MGSTFSVVLYDQPDDIGVVLENEVADRAHQCSAATGLALDDRRFCAGADADRQADMNLPAILDVLHLYGAFQSRARVDVEEETVRDEGGIDGADRIVCAVQLERRRKASVLQ